MRPFGVKRPKPLPEDDGETEDDDDENWADEPEDFPGEPKWRDYNMIDVKTRETLTDHQCLLLPSQIRGYALRSKLWSKCHFHLHSQSNH